MSSQEAEGFEQALEESAGRIPLLEPAKPPEDEPKMTLETLGLHSLANCLKGGRLKSQ